MNKRPGLPDGQSEMEARICLIKITRYRFRLFEAKFRREPEPDEPIFFDENQDHPMFADESTAYRQLIEAANSLGVSLDPVLKLLGLGCIIAVLSTNL